MSYVKIIVVTLFCLSGWMLACAQTPPSNAAPDIQPTTTNRQKVCLYFRGDALGAQGFMGMQYTAMLNLYIERRFELVLEVMENSNDYSKDNIDIDTSCDVFISTEGVTMKAMLTELAKAHPHKHFILVDEFSEQTLPNLASLYFHTAQAAYLAGVLAAETSQTGVLGIIGGRDLPQVHDFVIGFSQGAKATRKDIRIVTEYIEQHDPDANPWANLLGAAKLTELMAATKNVDVFFAVAGGSNPGTFITAKNRGLKAIGVDVNQDHLAKGVVLTSVLKHLDVALKQTVTDYLDGDFQGGNQIFDLTNGGVGLTDMRFSFNDIPPQTHQKLATVRQAIVNGKIQVHATWRRGYSDL